MAVAKRACNSNMKFLLQTDTLSSSAPHVLESLWDSNSSPTLHGSKSMLSFESVDEGDTRNRPLFTRPDHDENCDDDFDGCFHQPEKKRRLSANQVLYLEKNFKVENKLEPERKVQLAKELGLQPRQVAIWFQNRRARFKTKQLEKDYDSLKSSYDNLKVNYDNLLKENEKLKDEVQFLVKKLQPREKDSSNTEPNDPISPSRPEFQKPIEHMVSMVMCKQEDASSGSCESPHYTVLDPTESSHALGTDQLDFSQDEDDNNFKKAIFPLPYTLPKLEFGFSLEEQPFWLWP